MPTEDQKKLNDYVFYHGIEKIESSPDVMLAVLRVIGKDTEILPQNESHWRDYAEILWENVSELERGK